MATPGKWIISTNEEHWTPDEEFDTSEEAVAYGVSDFAREYGLRDGQSFYVGQVEELDVESMIGNALDGTRIVESMEEWLYDNVGDEVDTEIRATKEQLDDLEKLLVQVTHGWMAKHKLEPGCFTLGHVQSHVFEQCKEVVAANGGRCDLVLDHEGDCDNMNAQIERDMKSQGLDTVEKIVAYGDQIVADAKADLTRGGTT